MKCCRILDIGGGTTKGASDLSKWSRAGGLNFEATVLCHDDRIAANLGKDKAHFCSVENLAGLKDESYSGIIGLFSILYSVAPEKAISEIGRVLEPGGLVKANFAISADDAKDVRYDATDFWEILRKHDFAVDYHSHDIKNRMVILAQKPGGPDKLPDVFSIMTEDLRTYEEQVSQLREELN